MPLPNLSRLSRLPLRDEEATGLLILSDHEPAPHPYVPRDDTPEECVANKVRSLVFNEHVMQELMEGDRRLFGEHRDSYLRNDLVLHGGQWSPGVLQASYDYKILSNTKFAVRVHMSLDDGLCGTELTSGSVEVEVDDEMYRKIDAFAASGEGIQAVIRNRGNRIEWLKGETQFRDQRPDEADAEYAKHALWAYFQLHKDAMLYFANLFKEQGAEGMAITEEAYEAAIHEGLYGAGADAGEPPDVAIKRLLDTAYPQGELFTRTREAMAVHYFNDKAVSYRDLHAAGVPLAADYPYPIYAVPPGEGEAARYPYSLSSNITPRAFWLLHVLEAIEGCLIRGINAMLLEPPPYPCRGGALYEMARGDFVIAMHDDSYSGGGSKRRRSWAGEPA